LEVFIAAPDIPAKELEVARLAVDRLLGALGELTVKLPPECESALDFQVELEAVPQPKASR